MTVCDFIRNYYSTFHDEKHYELEHQLDGHKKKSQNRPAGTAVS